MNRHKELLNREDARRMAKTLSAIRAAQGEQVNISTRRMSSLCANVVAVVLARPASMRGGFELSSVGDNCVVLRRGAR